MDYELEGQGLKPGGNTGEAQGLLKVFSRKLPTEWSVCAKRLATPRAYLCKVVKQAFKFEAVAFERG